jgi:hypothetical protein
MEIGLTLVALIIAAHIWKLRKYNTAKKKLIEGMWEDEHAMDEVLQEDFNGKTLNIKKWIMKENERKIKSGQYVRTPDGGIITRAEARKHGLI